MDLRLLHAFARNESPITRRALIRNRLSRHVPLSLHRMRNKGPLVSFTFDDAPESAVSIGASLIEGFGAHATFFIATSLVGAEGEHWRHADADSLRNLAERGHEIGMHTHSHRAPVGAYSLQEFAMDFAQSRRRFAELVPTATVQNFAYPFGVSSLTHKAMLGRRVRSSRTTFPGVNAGLVDPHFLLSLSIGSNIESPEQLESVFGEAERRSGWLVLTLHDVAEEPSPYGCTPATLNYALAEARRRGFAIATMREALDLSGLP